MISRLGSTQDWNAIGLFSKQKVSKAIALDKHKESAPFFTEFTIPDGTGVRFCDRGFKGSLTVDVIGGRFIAEPFGVWVLKGLIISVSLLSL